MVVVACPPAQSLQSDQLSVVFCTCEKTVAPLGTAGKGELDAGGAVGLLEGVVVEEAEVAGEERLEVAWLAGLPPPQPVSSEAPKNTVQTKTYRLDGRKCRLRYSPEATVLGRKG